MTDVIEVQNNTIDVSGASPQTVEVGYVAQTVAEGGGTPSDTVTAETSYGQASTAGVSSAFARGDHTHGTPSLGTTSSTAAAGNHTHTGYQPIIRQAYITSGLVTLPDTSGAWQILNQIGGAPFELDIPAVTGEYVDITVTCTYQPASTDSIDIGVIVGSNIVRYLASGGSSPTSRGMPWSHENLTTFQTPSSPIGFTVTAGDLDGGNVRLSLVTKAAGTAQLYALSTFPFHWRAINHRTPG